MTQLSKADRRAIKHDMKGRVSASNGAWLRKLYADYLAMTALYRGKAPLDDIKRANVRRYCAGYRNALADVGFKLP